MNTLFPGTDRLNATLTSERESLTRELDPELRAEGLLSLAGREQSRDRSDAAIQIYAQILESPELPAGARQRAQERLDALQGRGAAGARFEVLLQRFTHEATDPTALFAMGAAGAAFKLTRALTLGRLALSPTANLLTRGFGARALAGLAGFGVEAAAFPAAGRMASLALGRKLDWSASTLGHELAASALTLGALRSGGAFFGQVGRLGGAGEFQRQALAQTGMLGGILLGRRLEEIVGLRQAQPGATALTDALVTLLQFNVAGRLSRGAFGEGFARWEAGLEYQTQALSQGNGRMGSSPAIAGAEAWAMAGGPGHRANPLETNILMAQSQDPGSGAPPSVRPAAASEAPVSGSSHSLPPVLAPELANRVQQVGESWEMDFRVSGLESLHYDRATGQEQFHRHAMAPIGMTFSKAFPAIVHASHEAMQRAPLPTVIHGIEEIQYFEPIRYEEPLRVRVSRKMRGAEGKPQQVILTREIFRPEEVESGRPLVVGKTVLVVGPDLSGVKSTPLSEAEFAALAPASSVVEVTPELIDAFCKASGDYNPVHVSDAGAQELGLPGRILHGMATFNLAEKAWREASGDSLDRPYGFKATFSGMARPGDFLNFHVQGNEVKVLNQRQELILTLRQTPPTMSSRTVEAPASVERKFGSLTLQVPAAAGREAVERARQRMAPFLPQLREVLARRPAQPWFIAGISDGMGFHSAVALMEAGVRNMVGGFYEPEALLKMESPIHLGRLANVEGLRIFAQERGVNFVGQYGDLVLPQGAEVRELPTEIRGDIARAQRRSWTADLNFINSIAFARWISPSPGVEQLKGIPSLDAEGRVVLMDMKPYDAKKYEWTLDSMGRNHGATLDSLNSHFGPASTSFFFTWAGGSQNPRILRGVYGGGALGHAKEIGETAAIRYHLRSQDAGGTLGHHKIVRFPDFPSFALFGIPGGGGFGMIARHVLEQHGVFADIGELAPRAFIEAFGGQHNLRNAAAQIELDVPESFYLGEIGSHLAEFHRRVREYQQAHPEWKGKALDLETSQQLLQGLVSPDYVSQIPKATE